MSAIIGVSPDKTPDDVECCALCIWSRRAMSQGGKPEPFSFCHRMPPSMIDVPHPMNPQQLVPAQRRPMVMDSDFCGEFESAAEETPEIH